jgi:hypothetical protein
MMCGCTACVVGSALQLLRVGKVHMAILVLETLLRSARHKPTPPKPAPWAGKAGARA